MEIGRKLDGSITSPPLSTGVTLDTFKTSGTMPCERDSLNIIVSTSEMYTPLWSTNSRFLQIDISNSVIDLLRTDTSKHKALLK